LTAAVNQPPAQATRHDAATQRDVIDRILPHGGMSAAAIVRFASKEHVLSDGDDERRSSQSMRQRQRHQREQAPRDDRHDQPLDPRSDDLPGQRGEQIGALGVQRA